MGHANVNSLTSKLHLVEQFLLNHQVKVFCISETHLLSSMSSSFISIPSYSLVRCDVSGTRGKHGVCIYVHDSVKYVCCDTQVENCVAIHLVQFNVMVLAVYRPPSYSETDNSILANFLLSFCADKEVLVLGDFNLPSLQWDREGFLDPASGVDKLFLETFLVLGLTQWVKEPTFPRSGNILDLILTTECDRVGSVNVLPPIPGCDHCPTLCEYLFSYSGHVTSSSGVKKRRWHRGKYNQISEGLSEVDWDFEFLHLDVHDAYTRFLDILSPLINEFVPLTATLSQSRKLPWKVHPPTSLLNRRKAAWDKYKASRSRLGRTSGSTRDALGDFFAINRSVRNFATASQSNYELQMIEDFTTNPRQLHAYIRHKKVGCPSVGPLKLEDGSLTDDAWQMAESLARAFESVYVDNIPKPNSSDHQSVPSRMPPIAIHLDDIKRVLQSLDSSSAAGLDNLHPMLLKSCAAQLSYPLFKLFSMSLQQRQLPAVWKKSMIIPIFKKGSRYIPLNYRPVSLTSVPCKCLERVIAKHLYEYLEEHNILSDHQFGFRTGRSTMDQMILVYNDISLWLDEGTAVDLVLFDFSKAFDVVSHDILLDKLSLLGIHTDLVAWTRAFLIGRTMTVAVGDTHSNFRPVKSGVPQGSVLGPVLFLLFVNHIASKLSCRYKIFADDLKIYMKICDSQSEHYHQNASNVKLTSPCLTVLPDPGVFS